MPAPVPVKRSAFGGLRLSDQGSVNLEGAIDGINFEAPRAGDLRRRGGYAPIAMDELAESITRIDISEAGDGAIVTYGNGLLAATELSGSSVATQPGLTEGNRGSFANVGLAGSRRTYFSNGRATRYWDGGAWLTPTVTMDGVSALAAPKARALCVTPWDSRLMYIGFDAAGEGPNGAGGTESTIFYAEAGFPDILDVDWYEHLTPGDGQGLVTGVVWRDRVIVFKERKLFTFTGTSVSGDDPALDYFVLDQGVGAVGVGAACSGRDGVYFCDRRGIFVTDGSTVVPLSEDLDPMFGLGDAPFYTGPMPDLTRLYDVDMRMVGDLLVVTLPTQGGRMMLVTDVRFGGWSVWSIEAEAVGAGVVAGVEQVLVAMGGVLYKQGRGFGDDNGAPISTFHQQGWEDFGMEGEVTLRSSHAVGTGNVIEMVGTDYGGVESMGRLVLGSSVDTWGDGTDPEDLWAEGDDPNDLWGGGEMMQDDWVRGGSRGKVHSVAFANVAGGDFSVQWVEHHLVDWTGAVSDREPN